MHGEKAHSRYFGEDAFKMQKGDNKELVIIPGASHCDLYDGGGKGAIPFDRILLTDSCDMVNATSRLSPHLSQLKVQQPQRKPLQDTVEI